MISGHRKDKSENHVFWQNLYSLGQAGGYWGGSAPYVLGAWLTTVCEVLQLHYRSWLYNNFLPTSDPPVTCSCGPHRGLKQGMQQADSGLQPCVGKIKEMEVHFCTYGYSPPMTVNNQGMATDMRTSNDYMDCSNNTIVMYRRAGVGVYLLKRTLYDNVVPSVIFHSGGSLLGQPPP